MKKLKKIGQLLFRSVPLVGEIVENLRSKDAGTGKLDWEKIITLVIRLMLLVTALIMLIKGKITFNEFEQLLP